MIRDIICVSFSFVSSMILCFAFHGIVMNDVDSRIEYVLNDVDDLNLRIDRHESRTDSSIVNVTVNICDKFNK